MARNLGILFGIYFLVYPIIYFTYNYMSTELGYSQYNIPGFWFGMLGFFLFSIVKSLITLKVKS